MYVAQVPATGAVTGKALSALRPWQAEILPSLRVCALRRPANTKWIIL